MFQDTISLAAMADTLSRSPDYRVLRRLVPRLPFVPPAGLDTKTAVLLDTETTGLAGVRDTFSAFNEPSEPIPPEVTALTGITDEVVAGQK